MKPKAAVLIPVLLVLLILQGFVHSSVIYPKWKEDYSPRQEGDFSELSPDQLLVALAGFREMIAGLLWVRADKYFGEGNYDAVLPMVRIVTILDPKQIDVYATGMWHIAYNFTDEAQRSDRRYVPVALALGNEGINYNPHTYELFYETGWLWYHKIDDNYERSVEYFEKADEFDQEKLKEEYIEDGFQELEAEIKSLMNGIPPARRNLLSQAYIRAGNLEGAMAHYFKLLDPANRRYARSGDAKHRNIRDTLELNLDNLLVRMAQRGNFAQMQGRYDEGDYDTKPPFDVGFSAQVTVIEPKVLQVRGTWNVLPVGTRLRLIFRDADFENAAPGGMEWDQGEVEFNPKRGVTFLQDQLFVKNQRFNRKIDMNRDVTMYPLTQDKYIIEFYWNTRSAPAHLKDKFGYNGEGMTDENYLNTEIREGQRVIFAQLELTREQLYRTGEWSVGRKTPVVETKNYRAPTADDVIGDLIEVPGFRAGDEPSTSSSEEE